MNTSRILGLSPAGFHRIAYTEFGPADGPLVFCVHGLTRNGRDFDRLAETLAADGRHVICPDIVGRGQSDWLLRPELYGYPQYLADMAVLLAKFGDAPVDWVGTSTGGLIGMMMAAQMRSPVRRLVMNDIGPFIPKAALERLSTYVGTDPQFASLEELEAYLRRIHAPFGITRDEDWRNMAEHSARRLPDGCYGLAYDPAIGAAFKAGVMTDIDLWAVWDMVKCPVLALHGMDSDLLQPETAAAMTRRGPKAQLVDVPGCGHAPALMDAGQIEAVAAFLR